MDHAESALKSVLNAAIAVQAILVAILAVALLLNVGSSGLAIINPAVLLIFLAACILWAFLLVRAHATLVWMPPVAYFGGCALFFAFGPLVYTFGNETTQTYLAGRVFPGDPRSLLGGHLLSLASVGLVFIGQRLALGLPMTGLARLGGRSDGVRFSPEAVGLTLLGLGFAYKFGIDYPGQWGFYSLQVPSALALLKQFIAVGLGILAFVATRRGGAWIGLFWLLWFIDTSFATLEFSKRAIAVNTLLPTIGYFAASRNIKRTFLLVIASMTLYAASTPYVSYSRAVVLNADGTMSAMPITDRIAVLTDFVTGNTVETSVSRREDLQIWWTRLDFTSKQAFVIDLIDQNIESPSMGDFLTRIIPRAIWPEKPIIVGAGREFYRLATGRDVQNFSSVSVYADIYWHGGIPAMVIFCPLIGVVLVVMMRMTRPAIENLNYAYFPSVLLGIVFAVGDLNKYADSVLTRILYFMAFFALLRLLLLLAEGTGRRTAPPFQQDAFLR